MLKEGDINNGDILSFGNDPELYEAINVQTVNGDILAFQVRPLSKPAVSTYPEALESAPDHNQ